MRMDNISGLEISRAAEGNRIVPSDSQTPA